MQTYLNRQERLCHFCNVLYKNIFKKYNNVFSRAGRLRSINDKHTTQGHTFED